MVVKTRPRPKSNSGLSKVNILKGFEQLADTSLLIPDIIEFALSDKYLGRNIYPRQGTMLKIAFLADELFTQFDYDVIGEWGRSFEETGEHGCQPDILERITICKAEGRPWFREWVNAIGRRGSKGFIGGVAGSYILWNYMAKGDPQGFYGVDRDKRLSLMVFAGKKEQAVKNQWKDLTDVIKGGNCFTPYLSQILNESLTIYSPYDFVRMTNRDLRGVEGADDMASFEIVPKESTSMAPRGVASFLQMFDEMAHVDKRVARADASELYESSTPSLDQFAPDEMVYAPSSTWQMIGKFYELWEQSLLRSDGEDGHVDKFGQQLSKGTIVRPEICMFQLESWDPYFDWLKSDQIPVRRGSTICYPTFKKAILEYDHQMRRLESANPETFGVERRSRWATVQDAYLNPGRVEQMFKPWPEDNPVNLEMKSAGKLAVFYKAHGDPSKSGANFGFAIAHMEHPKDSEFPHVVFDFITHWEPSSFEENNHEIDYEIIIDDMKGYIRDFMPTEFTFDQGYSAWIIQQLRKYVRENKLPKAVSVFERTATLQQNWQVAESFKTALGLGLVHAPPYEQARLELLFLTKTADFKVDHPTAGPVQTKDVSDCIQILTHALIGDQIAAFVGQSLSDVKISGAAQGGFPTTPAKLTQPDNKPEVAITGLQEFGKGRRTEGAMNPSRSGFRRR